VVAAEPAGDALPPGARDANRFSLFNAMSWQITLGSPVILYAKSLGASSTVLGTLAALTPLLAMLQIPAAHLLPTYGYRKFILAGWGSRTVCIFGLAVVPFLSFIGPSARLGLVLLLLFVFNLLRGMASGAWLPWISQIIPTAVRGRFLSRDQIFAQFGCLAALAMAAVTLSAEPRPWQFSLVFLFSAVGATMSLVFIRRVPDVTAPDAIKASGHRVPWRQMLAWPPFLRLLLVNLLWVTTVGGVGVFTIAFLRGSVGYSESKIVSLSILAVVGAICSLPWMGRLTDRLGSRPVLISCLTIFAVVLLGWLLASSGAIGCPVGLVAVLNLLGGMAGVNYAVANNRLAMAIVPKMGRNHFFALFTVITSVAQGLSPIGFGMMLDAIGSWHHQGMIDWNRYSIFFAMTLVLALVTVGFGLRLQEKRPGL
jgi:MFS family permease